MSSAVFGNAAGASALRPVEMSTARSRGWVGAAPQAAALPAARELRAQSDRPTPVPASSGPSPGRDVPAGGATRLHWKGENQQFKTSPSTAQLPRPSVSVVRTAGRATSCEAGTVIVSFHGAGDAGQGG